MPERHSFTEADDRHLIEYIAKNNPDASGRNGNNLYKTLVENPKRWPWAKSHPWQSWRERYKKNPVWFERKIRAHLKEQMAAAAPTGADKVSNKAEGSNQGGRTAKPKGPSKGVGNDKAEPKRMAPVNQHNSTTVDDGKPRTDSVKLSKDTGNASTDSGYASTTKKNSHESERMRKESEEEEEQSTLKKSIAEDDYMHELFGPFIEDDDRDTAAPGDPPASSDPGSPSTERLYPDLRNVDSFSVTRSVTPPQAPTPLKAEKSRLPTSPSPSPPVRHPAGSLKKRQLKRKGPDDDPFIDDTPPPSPTPEQPPATRKAPPVLDEGPFRNLYAQTRNPGENREVVVWPPNRMPKENEDPSQITAPTSKSVIGRKVQQQVNAVASSSKVKLPPSTALRPDDAFLMGAALQKSAQQPVPMPKGALLPKPQTPTAVVGPDKGTKAEQPPTKRQRIGPSPVTHQELAIPTSSPVTLIANNSRGNPSAKNARPSTRRIDLREGLKKRRVCYGKSSLLSSRGSTASASNPTNRRDSAASSASRHRQDVSDDEDIISLFERDLTRLGEQYGFALGVVKKMYKQFKTLEKTVLALQTLNAIVRGAQDKLYEEMQRLGHNEDYDTDDGDLIPEGVIPKNVSPGEKEKKAEHQESHAHNKGSRRSLNYKPLANDVEDQSEYSPPSKTRAGRYTRLQKEGREEEALIAASGGRFTVSESREARASGGREIRRTIRKGMRLSSPLDRKRLPTPDQEKAVGLRETGDEERHGEEDDDDGIELGIEHDEMDVSPDEYEVREPTPEVEHVGDGELVLKAEYKRLCSEVTLENQNILSAFEEIQDGDPRRRESGSWLQDRFSTLREAQEIRRQEYYRTEAMKAEEGEESMLS